MTNTRSMKILVLSAFVLFSMFYFNDVYANEHPVEDPTISILISDYNTQLEYESGDLISIEGIINDYNPAQSGDAVLYNIQTNSTIIDAGRFTPNADGTFVKIFVAGGPLWILPGEYVITFDYGLSSDDVTINYIGGISEYELENQIRVRVNDIPYVTGLSAYEHPVETPIISISISNSTQQLEYDEGDLITIEGIIENYKPAQTGDAGTYFIRIDNTTVEVERWIPNSDGTFEITFVVGDGQWPSNGEYVITFWYDQSLDEVTINYIGGNGPDQTEPVTQIHVRVNNAPYDEGDTIFITGVAKHTPESLVTIQITYDGTEVHLSEIQANQYGVFKEGVPALFEESGVYTVIATNNGETANATFTFTTSE